MRVETITGDEWFTRLADADPVAVALESYADGRKQASLTRSELRERVHAEADRLRDRGAGPGLVLTSALPNGVDQMIRVLSAIKVGATFLARPSGMSTLGWLGVETVIEEEIGPVSDFDDGQFEAQLTRAAPHPDAEPGPPYLLLSSGSTGDSKVVDPRAPRDLTLVDGTPRVNEEAKATALGWRPHHSAIVYADLHHASGLPMAMTTLGLGNRLVLIDGPHPRNILAALEDGPVDFMLATPWLLSQLLHAAGGGPTSPLRRLGVLVHGGAPCAPDLKRQWIELLGAENVYESYGMTEGVGITAMRGDAWLERPTSVGRPVHCQMDIVDHQETVLPPGTTGHIRVRAFDDRPQPRVLGGLDTAHPGGTYTTQDLGYVDEEGYLYLVGRADGAFVAPGGVLFHGAAAEERLRLHPGVLDAAVVGEHHPAGGAVPVAVVVPRDLTCPPADDDLRTVLRSVLSDTQVPVALRFVARIPRLPTGKVDGPRLFRELNHDAPAHGRGARS